MAGEYKILRIRELSRLDDLGEMRHPYLYLIKTAGGILLRVEVEPEDFTPEKVAPILLAKAKNADAMLAL